MPFHFVTNGTADFTVKPNLKTKDIIVQAIRKFLQVVNVNGTIIERQFLVPSMGIETICLLEDVRRGTKSTMPADTRLRAIVIG